MGETPKVIEILGPGCPRCQATHKVVQAVVTEAGLGCDIRKNESIDRMVELGVMATPAVVIDGKVVFFGRIPTPADVRRFLNLG